MHKTDAFVRLINGESWNHARVLYGSQDITCSLSKLSVERTWYVALDLEINHFSYHPEAGRTMVKLSTFFILSWKRKEGAC